MLIAVLIIVVLVVDALFGSEFQKIADEKGYGDSNKYFWYTFLFGIYGMLLVIALPDRNLKPTVVVTREENKEQDYKRQETKYEEELPDI